MLIDVSGVSKFNVKQENILIIIFRLILYLLRIKIIYPTKVLANNSTKYKYYINKPIDYSSWKYKNYKHQ